MIDCDFIDEYLSGDLSEDQATEFRRHATSCEHCQSHLEAYKEFQRLVVESKIQFLQDSQEYRRPVQIAVQGLRKNRQSRRSILVASWGIAISLAAVFVIGQFFLNQNKNVVDPSSAESIGPSDKLAVNDQPSIQTITPQKTTPVSVSLSDDAGYLAVPVETTNPEVTIFWLHPTIEPAVSNDSSKNPLNPDSLFARSE